VPWCTPSLSLSTYLPTFPVNTVVMRRLQGFQAAPIRPLRRLGHSCRHIIAASVQPSAPASTASSLQLSSIRALRTHPVSLRPSQSNNIGDDLSAVSDGHITTSLSASQPAPAVSSLLTLDQLDAFVRRHDHLCENMSAFSAAPSLSTCFAERRSVFASHPDDQHDPAAPRHTTTSDGRQRHSFRALHATDTVVAEVRAMLDRVTQEPHVLGSLTERQRHRLVADVCRIGYVMGLHSRCCALYVDAVLLPFQTKRRGNSSADEVSSTEGSVPSQGSQQAANAVLSADAFPPPPPASAGTTSTRQTSRTPAEASLLVIPDFVIEAAGEAGDLTTLEHCLAYAAAAASSVVKTQPEMQGVWLVASQVLVQCVRVALQRGWRGLPGTIAATNPLSPHREGDVSDSTASAGTTEQAVRDTAAATLREAQDEGARWRRFILRVLHMLHKRSNEEAFFSDTLRNARYRYVDAGGTWPAAQAVVYARCFCCCIGEVEQASPKDAHEGARRVGKGGEEETAAEGRAVSQDPSRWTKTMSHMSVRLTTPVLVVLLRSAVVAHQHDIAEWATLYVDACLDAWASDGGSSDAAAPATNTTTQTAQLDVLLVWYLRYLQQSGQRRRACCWLRRLRTRQPTSPLLTVALMSLPVLRLAARLAGDELDADLSLWCLQLCLGDAPGLSPTHKDIFACLCAFARCGLPTFDMVLQSLQGNGLLSPTAEEMLFARLLHARRSVQWRLELEQCLTPYVEVKKAQGRHAGQTSSPRHGQQQSASARFLDGDDRVTTVTLRPFAAVVEPRGTDGSVSSAAAATSPTTTTVLSARVMYQVLLVLQEGEHPAFMAYYRTFLAAFSEHVAVNDRACWALLALAWATLQHSCTPPQDVVYVVREVEQLMKLQAAHDPHLSKSERTTTAPPRPPPIAADLYHSLERRWASLYQRYPPSWWTDISSGEAPLLDPPLLQRMVAKARASAPASIPAFARFAKRRHLLPRATPSASELLVSAVRWTAPRQHDRIATCAGSFPLPASGTSEALLQLDRELWAAYVASVAPVPRT
jgi:hypothetical protein